MAEDRLQTAKGGNQEYKKKTNNRRKKLVTPTSIAAAKICKKKKLQKAVDTRDLSKKKVSETSPVSPVGKKATRSPVGSEKGPSAGKKSQKGAQKGQK